MKISYQWLKELTGLDWSPEVMAERLTLCGLCCEDIVPTAKYFENVVVGEIIDIQPIQGADKIKKISVDCGENSFDLVCGAPNAAVGQKVPVALVGANLAGAIEIKTANIHGIESSGMICSDRDLGISDDHSGIKVFDNNAQVGQFIAEYLDYSDYILDIELTPNRGDAMSATGIARDLAAIAGCQLKHPDFKLIETGPKTSESIEVKIDDSDACPRFTARIIRDITVSPSPWWVQKKLLSSGIRPVSNVVDITNLVMIETGNPIHAFDFDNFDSNKVLVRRAALGEKLVTLDGKEHSLSKDVLLITDGSKARAAAGVMGGADSEVTLETKNILLEVAFFDPQVIRGSRKKLGFVSEASIRFEKGIDPNNLKRASDRAAFLLTEICGGKVDKGLVDCYPMKIKPKTIKFRPQRCNEIIGSNINPTRMKEIFSCLEFGVDGDDPMVITVPTFCQDITREIDLIEEIVRIDGFDNIPDAIGNKGPLFTPFNKVDQFERELRRLMTGVGFDEILCHGLGDSRQASYINPDLPQVKIINPVSEELNIMRNDLAATAMQVVAQNIAHRNLDLRFFEIGKAYFPPDKAGEWIEEDRLLLIITGKSDRNWRQSSRPLDFYDLSGALDSIVEHYRFSSFEYLEAHNKLYADGSSFNIILEDEEIGTIGQVDSMMARRFEIKQPLYIAQIKLAPIFDKSQALVDFKPLPVYPASTRDIAMILDNKIRLSEVIEIVKGLAGDLAESVNIFDLYTGKQIGDGKKSVAISISFRSSVRSLESAEIDNIQTQIIQRLKQEFSAIIRDN